MQGVSRTWRSFIQAWHETYTCLDFSTTTQFVSKFSLQACINYAKGKTREVILSEFSDRSALSAVIRQCPQLSVLRIRNFRGDSAVFSKEVRIAQNLTTISIGRQFTMDNFHEILEGCASLHTLECEAIYPCPSGKSFINMRCLKISRPEDVPFLLIFPGEQFVS